MELQNRAKSAIWWIGLVSAVYEAVIAALVTGGVNMPVWIGAIGVGLATVLVYCNGNNPSLKSRY